MNEEEKEAIENLKDFKSISILYGNTFTMFLEQLKKYQEATDTVLNLITKLQKENEEKDKQIDLMAEFIEKVTVDMKIAFGENMLWDRREIKQYFADLVEKE